MFQTSSQTKALLATLENGPTISFIQELPGKYSESICQIESCALPETDRGSENAEQSLSEEQIVSIYTDIGEQALSSLDEEFFRERFCFHIALYLLKSENINQCKKMIVKIPVVKEFYEGVFQRLTSQRLCFCLESLEIFLILFKRIYECTYEKALPEQLSIVCLEKALRNASGYQRIPILTTFLPEQSKIRLILTKKFNFYVEQEIQQECFMDKIIDVYYPEAEDELNDSDSENYPQEKSQQFEIPIILNDSCRDQTTMSPIGSIDKGNVIDVLAKIMETVHLANIKPEVIQTKILKDRVFLAINSQLEKNLSKINIAKLVRLLYYCSKYNAFRFWHFCQLNFQCIQKALIEGLSLYYQPEEQEDDLSIEERAESLVIRDDVFLFLQEILQVKASRMMVTRVTESIVDFNLGPSQLEYIGKIAMKNSLLGESLIPNVLSRIELSLRQGKVRNKNFRLGIIKLIQNLLEVKYRMPTKYFQSLIELIRSVDPKFKKLSNRELIEGALRSLKIFLKKKIERADSELVRKYYWQFMMTYPQKEREML